MHKQLITKSCLSPKVSLAGRIKGLEVAYSVAMGANLSYNVKFMPRFILALERLALRQQVAVLKRKRPRPRVNQMDRPVGLTCW